MNRSMKAGRSSALSVQAAAPVALYHDAEYREDDADIEICVPVKKRSRGTEPTIHAPRGARKSGRYGSYRLITLNRYDKLAE